MSKAKRVAQANRRARFVLGVAYDDWFAPLQRRAATRWMKRRVTHGRPFLDWSLAEKALAERERAA